MQDLTKLERSLSEIHEWAFGVSDRDIRYQGERDYLGQYLNGEDRYSRSISVIYNYGMADIGKGLLQAEIGNLSEAKHYFQLGSNRMLYNKMLSIIFAKKVGNYIIGSLDGLNRLTLTALALGMPKLAKKSHLFVSRALEEGYAVNNGHDHGYAESFRYSAMSMTILNDWLRLPPPNLEKLGLPKDPVWMKYANHWREEDPAKFLSIVNAVCDAHVTRIALTDHEFDSKEYEFKSPFEAVYPVEILSVLRLREIHGLVNPIIEHPLMITPYARITELPIIEPLEDPLLDPFLAEVRKRDPEFIEAWDKFEV